MGCMCVNGAGNKKAHDLVVVIAGENLAGSHYEKISTPIPAPTTQKCSDGGAGGVWTGPPPWKMPAELWGQSEANRPSSYKDDISLWETIEAGAFEAGAI